MSGASPRIPAYYWDSVDRFLDTDPTLILGRLASAHAHDVQSEQRQADRQRYLLNAYRVLLTRARQGMVIFVPPGDEADPTRKPSYYDSTFDYLRAWASRPFRLRPVASRNQNIRRFVYSN